MAGRFAFQKFASGMSRSTGRLSARASASARAAAPDILVPRASEAGIGTISNGAAVHPGAAVGYAAKAGWPTTTGMPSTVVKKPTFLVSVGGMKRTYSSGAPNKLGLWGAKLAACWRDRGSVWNHPIAKRLGLDDELDRAWIKSMFIIPFIIYCLITMYFVPRPGDYGHGHSGSRGCSGCCQCLAGGSESSNNRRDEA
ncbi:uncharacterized protein LOC120712881 isoform X1 [Panicum virgatum]|uniref:uncharacterized protein LOC120712881 isoform X1 n=1 Tax=Panicum virgatum TaxID=38727 RepID=UPI0019D560CB|nr:uncharacterized protein LOC120712881 isoform X1 [Panicum virgatum]